MSYDNMPRYLYERFPGKWTPNKKNIYDIIERFSDILYSVPFHISRVGLY